MIITKTRTVTEAKLIATSAKCDHCGCVVKSAWGDVMCGRKVQMEAFPGMLRITLRGSYNGYFDGDDVDAHFCRDCSDHLCSLFPELSELIK